MKTAPKTYNTSGAELAESPDQTPTRSIKSIALSHLVASSQPRPLLTAEVDKLAASIKEIGLIQPITVISKTIMRGLPEPGWKIVAGHHRVAACRALGWTEIDALVIDDVSYLQSELIEIDENLCRAELSKAQRTKHTKRRADVWLALHPELVVEKPKKPRAPRQRRTFEGKPAASAKAETEPEPDGDPNRQRVASLADDESAINLEVAQVAPLQVTTHGGARPHQLNFAASTAAATGQSKSTTNRALAIAKVLTDDDLDKINGTSLDSDVEMTALTKLPAPERAALVERAAAGAQVSARPSKPVKLELNMGEVNTPTIEQALRAILTEVTPGKRPYSSDSYLPEHLINQAQQALAALQTEGASHE